METKKRKKSNSPMPIIHTWLVVGYFYWLLPNYDEENDTHTYIPYRYHTT